MSQSIVKQEEQGGAVLRSQSACSSVEGKGLIIDGALGGRSRQGRDV